MQWKGLLVLVILSINTALADNEKIEGIWVTTDDHSGKELSEVKIWSEDDEVLGKVIKLLEPEEFPICAKCKGSLKNKKIVGLTVLSGFKKEDDGDAWASGLILDPNNGKTYKAILTLMDEGSKLKVRGYIGIPALGRTQYWKKKQ